MSPEVEPAETASGRRVIDPDRLAELEEERRFLLRSIADLDRERVAGDVDEADYEALRDGYTARAAGVLRAIEEGRSELPPKPPTDWKRRIAVIAAVVVVGVVAGILVSRFSGQRDPGDTITGGTSSNQVAVLLSEGRTLLSQGQYGEASRRYLNVLDIEPDNVEALTYAGWVLAASSQNQSAEAAANLLAQSKQFIAESIAVDPTYADSYCLLAVIASQLENDPAEAALRREECLANNPSSEIRELIEKEVIEVTPTTG
jgi:tetratricopeptide (TPR) repeat protein